MTQINEAQLIQWRHHIHAHPELGFQEHNTAQYILKELSGIEGITLTQPTPTSVVATLVGTAGPGKTIALRADIDALPVQEANDVPFCSQNPGVGHMCGHDTHAAMLMAAIAALAPERHTLHGTVKFLFQHAEELPPGGAIDLVKAGVLDDVDHCIGLHIMNGPVGKVKILTDEVVTSSCDNCHITIHGKGSHSSRPHHGVDPILVGAEIILALHTIVSRNIDPSHFAAVSPNVFVGGTVSNVIPQTAELEVDIRAKNPDDRSLLMARVEELAYGIAKNHHAEATLTWQPGAKSVVQDLALVNEIKALAEATLGADNVLTTTAMSGSEDFSEFSEVVPSCMYFNVLGGESPYENHHPQFLPKDEALITGTTMEVAIVKHFLKG